MNKGRYVPLSGAAVACVALAACGGGSPGHSAAQAEAPRATSQPLTFQEQFRFKGDPAFTTERGGSAVWWNQDSWDVRSDTHYSSYDQFSESDPYLGNFVAVQKATTPSDARSEAVDQTVRAPGGDGSPGVGLMRVDFQGIESARLRNPLLISASRPGTVSFSAPLFATTGQWWEIAITSTAQPVAGEYTAIPGRQEPESLNDPITGGTGDGSTNGPGHRHNVQDSLNVISTGYPDAPACNGSGWHARWAVTSARGGKVTDHVNPTHSLEKVHPVNPRDHYEMYPWKIVYKPNLIQLYSDLNEDKKLELVDQWSVQIPWSEVYVNLLYVGYQAGHHPQAGCGLHTYGITQGQQTGWRDVRVSPVKYRQTYALPRPSGTSNTPRETGWMAFDLRDVNYHHGDGAGQPNTDAYDQYLSYLYCSHDNHGGLPCPDRAQTDVTLHLTITQAQLAGLKRAQFIGDVRHPGNANIVVNGTDIGVLTGQPVLPDVQESSGNVDEFEPDAWVRRGLNIPTSALHAGDNTFELHLTPDTDIDLDRLQLELDAS